VPTPETELQSILKASRDVEWLYRYVLQNVPVWRNIGGEGRGHIVAAACLQFVIIL